MLDESNLKKLQRFGITDSFIAHFEKAIYEFISKSNAKKIVEPTIIFSDIHANLPSLEMTLNFAKDQNINSIVSLGDLIEYNNQNNEVIELLNANNRKLLSSLRGNHDDGILQEDYFVSTMFHDHIKKELGQQLLNLPQNDLISVNDKKLLLTHSNPWNLDILYIFPENENLLNHFLEKLPCDGFLFGHSHIVTWYKLVDSNKFCFNPGSLGVSRDGTKTLHFAILYPLEQRFDIYELKHAEKDYTNLVSEYPSKISEYLF